MSYCFFIPDNSVPMYFLVLSSGEKYFKTKIEKELYEKKEFNLDGAIACFTVGKAKDIPGINKDLYLEANMLLKINRFSANNTFFFSSVAKCTDVKYIEVLEKIEEWKNNDMFRDEDSINIDINKDSTIIFHNIDFKHPKLKWLNSDFCILNK